MNPMPSALLTYTKVQDLDAVDPACLSSAESQRMTNISAPGRRQQFMCGRSLLRHTLELWTGKPAASHHLTMTEEGKPVCINGPSISITHSGDFVACAVTGSGRIGIDVEIPNSRRNTPDIARSYFSGEEADWLETQPEDRFYMLWVLKEAHLKAIGTGLRGLDSLRCRVDPPRIAARTTGDSLDGLGLYALGDAFLAISANHDALQDLVFERWDAKRVMFTPNCDVRTIATTHDLA